MNVLKMKGVVRAGLVAGGLVSVVAQADELPFYRAGAEPAVRAPASAAVSSAAVPLDSRTVQSAESVAVKFNSSGKPGAFIFVR